MKNYDLIIDENCCNTENRLIIETIANEIPDNSRVLDVGANSGWLIREIDKKNIGCDCCGIDNSELAVNYAQRLGADVMLADATNIPHKDESFDVVTVVSVFQQMDDEEYKKSWNECLRVLKPTGILIGVNAKASSGWGDSAIGRSPYVKRVIPQYQLPSPEVLSRDISENSYMFTIRRRDANFI